MYMYEKFIDQPDMVMNLSLKSNTCIEWSYDPSLLSFCKCIHGILQLYCVDWCLNIDISKPKNLMFDKAGRLSKTKFNFCWY